MNGHEFAGVIDSVGSAVTKWKVGDRVTADNTELCGYCEPCRSDKPLYCENFNSHGCNMPGALPSMCSSTTTRCSPQRQAVL